MSPEKVIDRIRKLYSKAESTRELGNEAEAMAFMAKVDELMTKYKLDASILTFDEREEADPMGQTLVRGRGKSSRVAWIEQLAVHVTKAYYCELLVLPGSDSLIILGRETDREVAIYVLHKLVNFLEAECKTQHNALRYRLYREKGGDMSEAHGFKASFFRAATLRIRDRFREMRVENQKTSSQYAVVVQQATQEVREWMEKNIKVSKASVVRGSRGGNAHGHEAGNAAGSRADLSGRGVQGGGNSGRKQIGGGR